MQISKLNFDYDMILNHYNNSLDVVCEHDKLLTEENVELFKDIEEIETNLDILIKLQCVVLDYTNIEDYDNLTLPELLEYGIDSHKNYLLLFWKLNRLRLFYPYFEYPIILHNTMKISNPSEFLDFDDLTNNITQNVQIYYSLFLQFLLCHNINNFNFSGDYNVVELEDPMVMGYKINFGSEDKYVYIKSRNILSINNINSFYFVENLYDIDVEILHNYDKSLDILTRIKIFLSNLSKFIGNVLYDDDIIHNIFDELIINSIKHMFINGESETFQSELLNFIKNFSIITDDMDIYNFINENIKYKNVDFKHRILVEYIEIYNNMNFNMTVYDIINFESFDPKYSINYKHFIEPERIKQL